LAAPSSDTSLTGGVDMERNLQSGIIAERTVIEGKARYARPG
jgi:hypothetical protein